MGGGTLVMALFVSTFMIGIASSQWIEDIRLVNGDRPHEGRVEVLLNSSTEWGTVCDDHWGKNDAEVVCRQLGYNGVIKAQVEAYFGRGTGPILLDNVACSGDETRLQECKFKTTDDCNHGEDASVICQLPGYLGCFNHQQGSNLFSFNEKGDEVNALRCIKRCHKSGNVFAGLQYGRWCYCGRSDTRFAMQGQVNESQCDYPCEGDSDLLCGGDQKIGVFDVTKAHCPDPVVPHGGARNASSFVFGSTVHFSCEDGFQPTGEPSLRCLLARGHEDETGGVVGWSSDVPQCIDHGITMFPDADATSAQDTTTSLGTIIGPTVVVVIISIILLAIFSVIRRRQKRRGQSIDGANGSVNKIQADVTPTSTYEIPSRPGTVNQKPLEYDVIADSTNETPSQPGAVNPNPNESDVTTSVMSTYEIPSRPGTVNQKPSEYDVIAESTYETPNPKESDVTTSVMSAYEIPRPPTNKNHQFTREQSSDVIVHEYADFKLSSKE